MNTDIYTEIHVLGVVLEVENSRNDNGGKICVYDWF